MYSFLMPEYAYMAANCPETGVEIVAVELGEYVQDRRLPVHPNGYVWTCPECGGRHVFNELQMRLRISNERPNKLR